MASSPRRWYARSPAWAGMSRASCRQRSPRRCRPNGGAALHDNRSTLRASQAPGQLLQDNVPGEPMNTMIRLLMVALLALPFAACKKQEAPVATAAAPVPVPVNDNRQAWIDYLSDVVQRNMGGIQNQPYV